MPQCWSRCCCARSRRALSRKRRPSCVQSTPGSAVSSRRRRRAGGRRRRRPARSCLLRRINTRPAEMKAINSAQARTSMPTHCSTWPGVPPRTGNCHSLFNGPPKPSARIPIMPTPAACSAMSSVTANGLLPTARRCWTPARPGIRNSAGSRRPTCRATKRASGSPADAGCQPTSTRIGMPRSRMAGRSAPTISS